MPTTLITGAGRGIGAALARRYRELGWSVHATMRDSGPIEGLEGATLHRLDVRDDAGVAALARALTGVPLDLVINNAGVGDSTGTETLDPAAFLAMLDTNVVGPFRVARALLPNLEAGTGRRVATISSRMGSLAEAGGGWIHYRTSKAAANMVARVLAEEWRPKGITVLTLHPGWVRTRMGGERAPLAPEESARGLVEVIGRAGLTESGRFWNYDGKELPW